MSSPDIRRYVFAEGTVLVAEIREPAIGGERTSYLVRVLGEPDQSLAHPSMLHGIVFRSTGLSERALYRLSQAIDRELKGRAA